MVNKVFSFAVIVMGLLISSCYHQYAKKNWDIDSKTIVYVYKIVYIENGYTISALTLENDNVYYYTSDSLLISYEELKWKDRKKVNDNDIKRLLYYISIKSLGQLENPDGRRCDCVTKNEYVIKIVKRRRTKFYMFPELLGCDQETELGFIENLRNAFDRVSANNRSQRVP